MQGLQHFTEQRTYRPSGTVHLQLCTTKTRRHIIYIRPAFITHTNIVFLIILFVNWKKVVDHVHFHVIPKPNADEGLVMEWKTKETNGDKLEELRKRILKL